jgi:hypothetical protein
VRGPVIMSSSAAKVELRVKALSLSVNLFGLLWTWPNLLSTYYPWS